MILYRKNKKDNLNKKLNYMHTVYLNYNNKMLELPEVIHGVIHDFLKLPASITITNKNIKHCFLDNENFKMVLYRKNNKKNKNKKDNFVDDYKYDLHTLYLLIQKYSYYENSFTRNEPISSILIDLLCSGSHLPCAYSSHSVFTNDTFEDLKEIIRIAPQSLKSNYGQLRCRYYLSPLDMACHNINIPMYVIEYILNQDADIYHYYEFNGCKTHIFEDCIGEIRENHIKQLFEKKGFNSEKMKINSTLHYRRYRDMYE